MYFFLSVTHQGNRKVILIMVTMGDLIKQGKIKEYIPPRAVTKLKAEPRASPVLQELFPDVFQAWIDSDKAVVKEHGQKQGGNT